MMITALSGSELSAFRSSRSIEQQITLSKTRLATGLRVTGPSPDPTLWRISTEFRTQASALSVLRSGIDKAHVLTARGSYGLSNTREALQAIQLLLARARRGQTDLSTTQRQLSSAIAD